MKAKGKFGIRLKDQPLLQSILSRSTKDVSNQFCILNEVADMVNKGGDEAFSPDSYEVWLALYKKVVISQDNEASPNPKLMQEFWPWRKFISYVHVMAKIWYTISPTEWSLVYHVKGDEGYEDPAHAIRILAGRLTSPYMGVGLSW